METMMKSITNCPGYFVTGSGEVYSCVKKKSGVNGRRGTYTVIDESVPVILTPSVNKHNGYVYISLGKYGKKRLHRVVAEAYIPNPDCLPEVNHLNENKQDNSVTNLEWCSRQHNAQHSLSKSYMVENVKTGEKQTVFNLSSFCKEHSLSVGSLRETILQQRRKQHKGWKVLSQE